MAKQSLAAQAGALAAPFTLPSVFQAPVEPIVSRHVAPYITFAHPKRADEWARIRNPQEGEMYLITPESIVHLPTAKLGWLCHHQYWGEVNAAGELLRSSSKEQPRPFKEHIEAVVLVYEEERITAANVQFRTTKCPAAKILSDALISASSPGWKDLSPAHAESLVCSMPFMRFFGEVKLGPQRTSRSSGLTYRTTTCTVNPTSISEWRLLKAFCEDAEVQKQLEEVAQRFEDRRLSVKAKYVD